MFWQILFLWHTLRVFLFLVDFIHCVYAELECEKLDRKLTVHGQHGPLLSAMTRIVTMLLTSIWTDCQSFKNNRVESEGRPWRVSFLCWQRGAQEVYCFNSFFSILICVLWLSIFLLLTCFPLQRCGQRACQMLNGITAMNPVHWLKAALPKLTTIARLFWEFNNVSRTPLSGKDLSPYERL